MVVEESATPARRAEAWSGSNALVKPRSLLPLHGREWSRSSTEYLVVVVVEVAVVVVVLEVYEEVVMEMWCQGWWWR